MTIDVIDITERGDIKHLVELDDGALLVGVTTLRESSIFRVDNTGVTKVWSDKSHLRALKEGPKGVWVGTFRNSGKIWFSADNGRTFGDPRAVPFSFQEIVPTDREVWVAGIDGLARSVDHGKSWDKIELATKVEYDSRFAEFDGKLCQYGTDGLWVHSDGGRWIKPYEDANVVAIDHSGRFGIQEVEKGTFQLVALEEALIPKGIPFTADYVRQVRVDGKKVAVFAGTWSNSPADAMKGWLYLTSSSLGRRWRQRRVSAWTSSGLGSAVAYMGRTHEYVRLFSTTVQVGTFRRGK